MRKKIVKIGLILIMQIIFVTSVSHIHPVLALCDASCNLLTPSCVSPCDSCPVCSAAGGGIYNPVIDPSVGWGGGSAGAGIIAKFIAEFMSIAFILAGLALLAMILFAGFEWMTAGGDQNKLKSAQGRLTSALIGFTIVVALRAILGFIAEPLGVPWLDTLKITWPTP